MRRSTEHHGIRKRQWAPPLVLALVLFSGVAHASDGGELGSLRVDYADDARDTTFAPTEFLDYRVIVDRRGQQRLQGSWRMTEGGPVPPMFTVVQFAAGAEGDTRLGVSLLVNHDRLIRNYTAGCSPTGRKQCDPAAIGLAFDRNTGELKINATFQRLTLDDGPDAAETVRVSGVLRVRGEPAAP